MVWDLGIEEELEWRSKRPSAKDLKCANCNKQATAYIFDTPSCKECGLKLIDLHAIFNYKK